MTIEINTETSVIRGIKYRKVVSIFGVLPLTAFPEEYGYEQPCICCFEDTANTILKRVPERPLYKIIFTAGGVYTETQFQEDLEYIRNAGMRAHELKMKAKLLSWSGKKETFLI